MIAPLIDNLYPPKHANLRSRLLCTQNTCAMHAHRPRGGHIRVEKWFTLFGGAYHFSVLMCPSLGPYAHIDFVCTKSRPNLHLFSKPFSQHPNLNFLILRLKTGIKERSTVYFPKRNHRPRVPSKISKKNEQSISSKSLKNKSNTIIIGEKGN